MAANNTLHRRMECGVTVRQFRFLLAYAASGDVKTAANAAGYKSVPGCYGILKLPIAKDVLHRIKTGEVLDGEAGEQKRQLIEELKSIAYADVRNTLQPATVQGPDGPVNTYVLAPPETWTDQTAAAVARIKFHPEGKGGGVAEVAFWPKLDAIKQLALLFGEAADKAIPHVALGSGAEIRRFERAKDITPAPADSQSAGDGQEAEE